MLHIKHRVHCEGRGPSLALIWFLLVSMLPSGTGFVPKHCRRTTSGVASKFAFPSVRAYRISQTQSRKGTKKKASDVEFKWLTWVYRQWEACRPGEVSEEVLKQMEPAISTWGRRMSPVAAERAEELLERIVEEYVARNPHAHLSVSLFNSAMDAHAKIGNPEGVQRILRRMDGLRKEHESLSYLKPDVVTMSTLATALAKSRQSDARLKAEAVLTYMESQNLSPTTRLYNAVLHASALSPRADKAVRVEEIVKQMESRYNAGQKDCRPDIYSYQSLILAWSRTPVKGAPQKCEGLLQYLQEKADKGEEKLAPNAHCFNAAIYAWARSKDKDKARHAYQLLTRMRQLYQTKRLPAVRPNIVALTTVINACSRVADESEKEDAFQIAQLAMEEAMIGEFGKPNFLTFAAFLGVCSSTLLPSKQRDDAVRTTFERCCDAGQVGHIVLEKLKKAASPALYEALVGEILDPTGTPQPPRAWTRNVKGERGRDSGTLEDAPSSRTLVIT